jgi:hypothetical protein
MHTLLAEMEPPGIAFDLALVTRNKAQSRNPLATFQRVYY